jgi:thymidine kinase
MFSGRKQELIRQLKGLSSKQKVENYKPAIDTPSTMIEMVVSHDSNRNQVDTGSSGNNVAILAQAQRYGW